MISVNKITKVYPNNTKALDGVSFKINEGEICGYVGANGAGKSTTIKILAGILKATSGTAVINGYDVNEHPNQVKSHIGYVPESGDLFLSLSPYDFLEFVCRMYNMEKEIYVKRIYSFCEMFDLKNEVLTPMFSFSKGMRQKVLIIASLIHNPDVILWDEPLGGIDYSTTLQIRDLMKELAELGKTFLYSTHMIETIDKMCSRVIMIKNGKIVYDDNINGSVKIDEIFKTHALPDSAGNISSIYKS